MRRTVLLMLSSVLLTACWINRTAHLYPVQGPLMQTSPNLAIPLTAGFSASITMPSGETFTGKSTRVDPGDVTANKTAPQWDLVYGAGFFTANVLGAANRSIARLKGSRGGTLIVEFLFNQNGTAKGIAMDEAGNVFKMAL